MVGMSSYGNVSLDWQDCLLVQLPFATDGQNAVSIIISPKDSYFRGDFLLINGNLDFAWSTEYC